MEKAKTQQETIRIRVDIADVVDVAAVRTLASVAGLNWRDWYRNQIEQRVHAAFAQFELSVQPFAYAVGFSGEPWTDVSRVEGATDEGEALLVPILYDVLRGAVYLDMARWELASTVARSMAAAVPSSPYVGTDLIEMWSTRRVREQEWRERRAGLDVWSDLSNVTATVLTD